MIKHQNYYKRGNTECIEAIKDSLSIEGYRGFLKGNILKYVWRYDLKNGKEDLDKAEVYLKLLIDTFNNETVENSITLGQGR